MPWFATVTPPPAIAFCVHTLRFYTARNTPSPRDDLHLLPSALGACSYRAGVYAPMILYLSCALVCNWFFHTFQWRTNATCPRFSFLPARRGSGTPPFHHLTTIQHRIHTIVSMRWLPRRRRDVVPRPYGYHSIFLDAVRWPACSPRLLQRHWLRCVSIPMELAYTYYSILCLHRLLPACLLPVPFHAARVATRAAYAHSACSCSAIPYHYTLLWFFAVHIQPCKHCFH